MTLKLLLSLLFIVWGVTSAEEFSNQYLSTEDVVNVDFCSHDSYLKDKTLCSCNVDYGGDYCLNRKCRNYGFDGSQGLDGQGTVDFVDRCICPTGFLGRNCEPVKCVRSDTPLTPSAKNEKAISILATYNTRMKEMWKKGSIVDLVCEYEGYSKKINLNSASPPPYTSTITKEDCKNNIHKYIDSEDICKNDKDEPIPCEPLKIDHLDTLVQFSPPNSIVFVVTNMNLTSNDESYRENIIATAIARRIQINVIVYNNTYPLLTQQDPSLLYLSEIASATLGTFVLPSIDSNNEQYGIVKSILDIWNGGNGVSTVFTNSTPTLFVDPTLDYFVAAQTDYGHDLQFNVDSSAITVVNKTDYWKLYKLTAENPRLTITGQRAGTLILVYAIDTIRAFSAFTSSEDGDGVYVDGAYSTSVNGTSYQLVLRLETATSVLQALDIDKTVGTPETLALGGIISGRPYCIFNLKIDATCTSVGASIVTVLTTDKRSVSFPVYCASRFFAEQKFNNFVKERVGIPSQARRQSFSKDVMCSDEIPSKEFGSRSFVVIAENSRDTDVNKSSVDNLFLNKNSLFYQLNDYLSRPLVHYSSFVASLTDGSTTKLEKHSDYGTFVTKVMNATSTERESSDHSVPVNVINLLMESISSTNYYSDILFVINYNVSTDASVAKVLEALAERRARLYVMFVQTYGRIDNDVYKYMNDLSVASGGVAIRLNDYNDLHEFFVKYFSLLVANDIVAKSYSENQKSGLALNNVYLTSDKHVILLTNEDLIGDGAVNATINVADATVVALSTIGELQLFTVTPSKAGSYNIPALFSTSGLAKWANIILMTNMDTNDFISVSFLDQNHKNRNDVVYGEGEFTPVISSTVPFGEGSTISITYSDALNPTKPVYTGSIVNLTTCQYEQYKYTTNFGWICSVSDGLYHLKIDRITTTGNISRTFPIKCLGESSGDCLNGGTQTDVGSCVCPVEWSGAHCELPICLNGGTMTPGNTCECPTTFTGYFCEIKNAICTSSPSQPNYRADLSALFIVADVQALAISNVTTPVAVTGIPITVILYGDGSDPRIVQSTSNGQHLPDALKTPSDLATTAPTTNDSMYKAISLALDSQLTDRSMIVVLTSNPDSDIDGDLLIRLAANRAEIRVLSTSSSETLSENYLTLSLIGNSIPIKSTDFDDYFQKYITPLFQALQFIKSPQVPQRVFNVFQTGIIGNTPITVSIPRDSTFDSSDAIAFVHAYKGKIDGSENFAHIGLTRIYTIFFDATQGKDITLSETQPGEGGYYAIEVISYLKTEYGFNNDTNGENEALNVGASFGQTNTITISSAPFSELPTSNPGNFPSISIREIFSNGTVSVPTSVAFTRKNSTSCFYEHFAAMDVCSSQNSTLGYQVQLTTRTSTGEARQQQFVLTCHKTTYQNNGTTCGGKGSPLKTCDCDQGFYGIDCSLPTCENGVRDGSVCRCPIANYGLRCEKNFLPLPATTGTPAPTTLSSETSFETSMSTGATTPPSLGSTPVATQSTTLNFQTTTAPPEVRVAAFVIDVIGQDDYAFNETTTAIVEYVKLFGNVHYVMLTANWNTTTNVSLGFQKYSSIDKLSDQLTFFWGLRKVQAENKVASLSNSLRAIFKSYNASSKAHEGAMSSNIFYATQIGLSDDDDLTSSLAQLESFDKSSLVFSKFSKNADESIMNSLKKFSSDVTNVRDYYNGVKTMVANTKSNDNVKLPEKPDRACVYGLQSNIIVPIDRSMPTSDAQVENLSTFLTNFREKFNYIENDEGRCETDTLPDFYNERTAITSFPYYDGVVKTMSYCPSQYTTNLNFPINGSSTSPTYSDKLVKTLGKYINKNDCVCNRYSDDSTIKYVVWVPRAKAPVTDDFKNYLKLNTANAYHFVVPFYDVTDKDNDLYYQILNQQGNENAEYFLLPNAATGNVTEIIDELSTKLCEIVGVDPTAIPPALSRMHFASRHDNIYSELWNN